MKFKTILELSGDHLEGDTGVIFHGKHPDTKSPGNIIIRGNDIGLDIGLDYDNSRNSVDISKLSKELDYAKALPAIYTYPGIDYLPTFYRKRKVRPMLLMTKNNHLLMHLWFWAA